MALYTLKQINDADDPLKNYTGNNRWVRNQMASLGYIPSQDQTQLYNAIGRNADVTNTGDDNFFTKKAKSIENALGTTGASLVGWVDVARENQANENRQKKAKQSMEDIVKKYGYNNKDEFWDASNAAEKEIFSKYGFDSDAYWDKHAELWSPANKDSKEVKALEKTRQNVINRMSKEDADVIKKFENIENELKGQSQKNVDIANKASEDWKNYRENSYVGQKTNQDRGKFLGSAINTLSTASDIMLPGAGVAFNAVQGGIEGIADELEQNGLENFDWGRAGQNALTGATVGAVTGAVNKGLSNALAKRGGNVLKGGNKLTQMVNNFNANNPVGQLASTLGTGAARGAVSGAVGGATGAGLQSALAGQDIGQGVANALQGAVQGAQQGATTGAIMTGANMVANKTPGVGDMLQKFNQAGEDWNNSGENFGERWKNTRAQDTWGNRFLDEQVANANAIKNGLQDVGEGISVLAQRGAEKIPGAVDSLRESPLGNIGMSIQDVSGNGRQAVMPDDIKNMRINDNMTNIPEVEEAGSPETLLYRKLANENNNTKQSTSANNAQNFQNGTGDWDNIAKEYGYNSYDEATQAYTRANPGKNADAGDVLDWMDNGSQYADKKAFTQAQTGKQIKSKRAIVEEITNQFNPIDKPTMRQTKPNETFYNIYDKMGLSDGDQIRQAVHYAEPGELLPTIIREAAGQAGLVDMSDAQTLVSDLGLGKKQNYTKTLNVLEDIIDSTPSTISGNKNGVDALELQRTIEAMASDAMGTSGEYHIGNNVVDQTTAKNLMRIANAIGENLDKAAVANGAVEFAINKYAPELDKMRDAFSDNPKWAGMVENDIRGAKTIADLRHSIKDLTRASIFINNGDEVNATIGGRVARNSSSVPTSKAGVTNKIVNTIVDKANSTPLARKLRLRQYEKGINSGAEPTVNLPSGTDVTAPAPETTANANYNPQTRLYDVIGRTEGAITGNNANNGTYLANVAQEAEVVPNTTDAMMQTASAPTTDSQTALYNTLTGTTPNQTNTLATQNATNYSSDGKTGYFPTTGDYWTDIIAGAMSEAIDENDVNSFATLYQMYQESLSNLQKQAQSASTSTKSTKLTDTQRRANAAMNSLDRISTMAPDLGYNLSGIPVIGNIATWGGNDYESEAKSLAQQIGYMVSGANIKEEEAYNIGKAYVPQPFDSEQTRKSKLQRAYDIIQQYQNGYAE